MPEFRFPDEQDKKEKTEIKEPESGKKKKKIKNKWFFIGLAVVIVIVVFKKIQESRTASSDSGLYEVPLGYGSTDGTAGLTYYDDALNSVATQTNEALDSIYKEFDNTLNTIVKEQEFTNKGYDTQFKEMESQLTGISKENETLRDTVEKQTEDIAFNNVIAQMKENSDKALITSSQSEKDYLHKWNSNLADSIGATFNDNDGYWYLNGQRLYSTALQTENANRVSNTSVNKSKSSGSSSSSSSSSSRKQTLQSMQNNSKLYNSVTNEDTKRGLFLANQEMGKSLGLNYDSASGKWKDSNGNDAWDYGK